MRKLSWKEIWDLKCTPVEACWIREFQENPSNQLYGEWGEQTPLVSTLLNSGLGRSPKTLLEWGFSKEEADEFFNELIEEEKKQGLKNGWLEK